MALYAAPTAAPSMAWFPFASTNPSSTGLVYNGSSFYTGPFNPQQTSTVGWLPDSCKAYFQSSQNFLQAAGRVYCGVFYESPNLTWCMSNGQFPAATTTIDAGQI